MFISKAWAQESLKVAGESAFEGVQIAATDAASGAAAAAPDAMTAFAWNIGLVLVMVVLFYVLLIAPQQKRFKQHSQMLAGLKKGDRVVTGGGLVGTIDKLVDDHEVVVDLGNGVKVTALRSTIHGKDDPLLRKKPANDGKPADGKGPKKDSGKR